jgi:putative tricarboxylic transport membrane protein
MITVHAATKRRPDGAALVIAALLAALGAVLIWQGSILPEKGGYAGIGSGGVPKFLGVGLLALSLAHVVTALRSGAEPLPPSHLLPVVFIVAGLGLQLLLLRPMGFAVASGLLFALTAAGFGKRNFLLTLPLGVGLALMIYGVFDQLLKLKLPAGFLETLIFGG